LERSNTQGQAPFVEVGKLPRTSLLLLVYKGFNNKICYLDVLEVLFVFQLAVHWVGLGRDRRKQLKVLLLLLLLLFIMYHGKIPHLKLS
jgi:hypothetical protein